jgi:hypothetical protein
MSGKPTVAGCAELKSLDDGRVKLNQFIPKNCAVGLAKIFDKFGSKTSDNLAVFNLECFVSQLRHPSNPRV